MSRREWKPADTATLALLAGEGRTAVQIAKVMRVRVALVSTRARRHGIKLVRAIGEKFAWSPAIDAEVMRRYPNEIAETLASDLGCTVSALYSRAFTLGAKKSAEFAAQCTHQRWLEGRHENSRRHQFRKGDAPMNKGRPWGEWMPNPDACRATQFEKGQMSGAAQYNYRPIGSLRISKDGKLERKVTDDQTIAPAARWKPVSRLVWEAANGPIPAGHAVAFRDGKRTAVAKEITLDRLELVSRGELMRRNSYHTRYPKEVVQLIQLKGALNRKINNRSKTA